MKKKQPTTKERLASLELHRNFQHCENRIVYKRLIAYESAIRRLASRVNELEKKLERFHV